MTDTITSVLVCPNDRAITVAGDWKGMPSAEMPVRGAVCVSVHPSQAEATAEADRINRNNRQLDRDED